MKDFARIVAERRKKLNMTQEELAHCLDITPQAVSKWENSIGLPDVTLFPRLAEALQISLEELFGIEKPPRTRERGQAPQSFEGMPLIAELGGKLCYSVKRVKSIEETRVLFCDGSIADHAAGCVTNCGEGEIRLIRAVDAVQEDLGGEYETKTLSLGHFTSMELSLSHKCELRIVSDVKREPSLFIKARAGLIAQLHTDVAEDTLTVRLDANNPSDSHFYQMEIHAPFIKGKELKLSMSGSVQACVEPDFEVGEVSLSGSGSASAGNFESFTGRISGSGDITLGAVSHTTKLRIAGSGDISINEAHDPDIRIAGSGDVCCSRASGSAGISIAGSGDVDLGQVQFDSTEISVSGSGDVRMEGEVSVFKMSVSGSGSLIGEHLTVDRATLNVKGAGEITLGRIITESQERLSRDAVLRVGKRG